jgi:hypothetical protein
VVDAHAHVQRLVSVVRMATVLKECLTEDLRSFILFLWVNGLNARDINKGMFPLYGGKCFSRKAVHSWVANVSLITGVEMEVPKWQRQQSIKLLCCWFPCCW